MGAWHFFGSFCWKNSHAHKIPPFRGRCWGFLEGGVEVPILFLWARGFFRIIEVLPRPVSYMHPRASAFKARGVRPAIRQLRRAPVRGTTGPQGGTAGSIRRAEGLQQEPGPKELHEALSIAPFLHCRVLAGPKVRCKLMVPICETGERQLASNSVI